MSQNHNYAVTLEWSGARQGPTVSYTSYSREYTLSCEGKANLLGSSDKAFRGDPALYNPEDLLVSSLAACHMLWYLHLCSANKIQVISYIDKATGIMEVDKAGKGRFTEVSLAPTITISAESNAELAAQLHQEAHEKCFIANSINFPVKINPTVKK